MDIYDFQIDGPKPGILDKVVQAGQKVEITRMVTIRYTVDVSDFLDESGESDISLEDLIENETDNVGAFDIESNYGDTDIVDDQVISVEIS